MKTRLYRSARGIVRLLPGWLLRFRPFVVYEIRLSDNTLQHAIPPQTILCRISWVSGAVEASALRPLASDETIHLLDTPSCRAAAAWVDDRIIGCVWIARQTFQEADLGLEFTLLPSDAWLFSAHVNPEWRCQGVYRQLLEWVTSELVADGFERILFGVSVGNEVSRRAHVRHGAVKVGSIMAIKSFGACCCLRTGKVTRVSQPLVWRRLIQLTIAD